MSRGKGALQQGLEIGTLAVLHVIDMPSPRGRVLDPPFETQEAPRLGNVTGLCGDHENCMDPFHRQDADDAGKRSIVLGTKYLLQFAGDLFGAAPAGGENRVGLPGERVDIEGADHSDQSLADRRSPTDDQRVAGGFGGDFATLSDIRFEHLRQILGRSIFEGNDLGACADGPRAGHLTGGKRRNPVDAVIHDQCRPVLVEQRFERRQQLRTRQRLGDVQGCRSLDAGVDRVVEFERRAEDGADDLANVGIDEGKRNIARFGAGAGRWRSVGRRRRHAVGLENTLPIAVDRDDGVLPRRGRLQRGGRGLGRARLGCCRQRSTGSQTRERRDD